MANRYQRLVRPKDDAGPLTWLHKRRDKNGKPLISSEELAAGEKLAADFHAAMLNPKVTASWSAIAPSRRERRGPPGLGVDIPDRAIGAKQRFEAALKAVGSEHANLLIDVCCFEKGLTEIEKEAGWPQRSGKVVLQFALRQLARHYGLLPSEPSTADGAGRIRHWGADNYRPKI